MGLARAPGRSRPEIREFPAGRRDNSHYRASRNPSPEGAPMPPTLGNGKICYVELPATNIAESAEFYKKVFGWNIRKRGNGSTAFDDSVGEVSGSWIEG